MRIVVVSDSHGSSYQIENAIEQSKPDVLIFLGDGLREIENLKALYSDIDFYYVRGNCDFSFDEPTTKILKLRSKTVFITHGHIYNVKYSYSEVISAAEDREADIVLFGHTHVAYTDYDDGLYVMNPGSVAQPNSGRPSYGVVDITDAGVLTNIVYL